MCLPISGPITRTQHPGITSCKHFAPLPIQGESFLTLYLRAACNRNRPISYHHRSSPYKTQGWPMFRGRNPTANRTCILHSWISCLPTPQGESAILDDCNASRAKPGKSNIFACPRRLYGLADSRWPLGILRVVGRCNPVGNLHPVLPASCRVAPTKPSLFHASCGMGWLPSFSGPTIPAQQPGSMRALFQCLVKVADRQRLTVSCQTNTDEQELHSLSGCLLLITCIVNSARLCLILQFGRA